MSGLAADNVLYIGSDQDKMCFQGYPIPTLSSRYLYLDYSDVSGTRDIAYHDGDIWVANDNLAFPVCAFNISGQKVDTLSSSMVPGAYGLTFDDEEYLWVSNLENSMIYQVDVFSTSMSPQTWGAIKTGY